MPGGLTDTTHQHSVPHSIGPAHGHAGTPACRCPAEPAAGLTLLAGSLVGLRIHRDAAPVPTPHTP